MKIPRLQEDDIKGSTKLKRVLQGFTVSHPTGTLIENEKVDSSDIGSGIAIGDVSFIDQTFGFSPQFNVFLPADHPVNAQAPPNFSSLGPLDPEEMSSAPEYFPAGTAIVSKGVDVTRSPEDPSHIFCYQYQESESAVMILPDGAKRVDCSATRIWQYASEHYEELFTYFSSGGCPQFDP
ncbi:hypothetical protein CPC08DRAFT_817456 [Agrocybe pediades]|nr:hypothetical protein CPC08DRAFT_817456 [Agrocybe pediades]